MTTPARSGRVPDPIFVSHSHKDNDWCREFVATLTAAGWDVWYDEKGLRVGTTFLTIIQEELLARPIIMPILTPAALASKWVKREVDLAMLESKEIIPVLQQDTSQAIGFIKLYQWIYVVGLPAAVAAVYVAQEMGYTLDRRDQPPLPPPPPDDLRFPKRANGDEVRQPDGAARPQSSTSRQSTQPLPPPQPPPPSPIPVAGEALDPSAGRAQRAGEWSASDFDSHELEAWDHHDDAPFELPESPDDTYERTIQEARKARERNRTGAAYQRYDQGAPDARDRRDTRNTRGRREPEQANRSDSGAYKAYDPYDSRERRSAGRRTPGWDDFEDDIEWDDGWDDGWQTGQWETGWATGMRSIAKHSEDLSQSLATLAQLSAVGAPLSRLARVRMLFRRRPTAAAMLAFVLLGAIVVIGGGLFGIIGLKTGIIVQSVAIVILIVVVIAGLAAVTSLTALVRAGYGPLLRKLI